MELTYPAKRPDMLGTEPAAQVLDNRDDPWSDDRRSAAYQVNCSSDTNWRLPLKIMTKRKSDEGTQFVRYFGPLLDALRKLGGSGTPDEVVEQVAVDLGIPDEVQNELLASGELRYRNRVAWARFYLVREGLLDSSKRGVWSLTERGRNTKLDGDRLGRSFISGARSSKSSVAHRQFPLNPKPRKSRRAQALRRKTIAHKRLRFFWLSRRPHLSDLRSGCCEKRALLRLWLQGKAATGASMGMEPCR